MCVGPGEAEQPALRCNCYAYLVIKLRLSLCDILQKPCFRYTSNTCSFYVTIHFFYICATCFGMNTHRQAFN
jgi:hypothetical protein